MEINADHHKLRTILPQYRKSMANNDNHRKIVTICGNQWNSLLIKEGISTIAKIHQNQCNSMKIRQEVRKSMEILTNWRATLLQYQKSISNNGNHWKIVTTCRNQWKSLLIKEGISTIAKTNGKSIKINKNSRQCLGINGYHHSRWKILKLLGFCWPSSNNGEKTCGWVEVCDISQVVAHRIASF